MAQRRNRFRKWILVIFVFTTAEPMASHYYVTAKGIGIVKAIDEFLALCRSENWADFGIASFVQLRFNLWPIEQLDTSRQRSCRICILRDCNVFIFHFCSIPDSSSSITIKPFIPASTPILAFKLEICDTLRLISKLIQSKKRTFTNTVIKYIVM